MFVYILFILDGCGWVTEVGAKCIGEYLGINPQLQKLEMSNIYIYKYIGRNEIEEAGYIGEGLSHNSTLLHLYLSENEITREEDEKLAKGLTKNNTLVTLDLGIYINI